MCWTEKSKISGITGIIHLEKTRGTVQKLFPLYINSRGILVLLRLPRAPAFGVTIMFYNNAT